MGYLNTRKLRLFVQQQQNIDDFQRGVCINAPFKMFVE